VIANREGTIDFPCFGTRARVYVGGEASDGQPESFSARRARRQLLDVHARLSRFRPDSELSRMNSDPEPTVRASVLLRTFVRAAVTAADLSGGLVDATLLGELEGAGYSESREGQSGLTLAAILDSAPPRGAAHPGSSAWRSIEVDDQGGTISRPPGLRLDSGGIAKGLAADLAAAALERHPTYAVDCAGDMRIGGTSGAPRTVGVADPFGPSLLTTLEVTSGGVATSGISRTSWRRGDGVPAHHLLDPSTGLPAYTGVFQVTALAPTALEAEVRAKTALLRGPDGAPAALPHGGVVVLDDGSFEVVAAADRERRAAPA
jgi:thiamine biosynthesis lipoprotein